jgi:hypothetical protein
MKFWILVIVYSIIFSTIASALQYIIGIDLPPSLNFAIGVVVVFPISFVLSAITIKES